jgi:hypothetical protein
MEVYYADRYNRVGYHKHKQKNESGQQQNVLRSFQPMPLSLRNLSNKFSDPSRNLCRRVYLACRYELEGSTQSAHIQLFQSFPLRPTCDNATATFFHSG